MFVRVYVYSTSWESYVREVCCYIRLPCSTDVCRSPSTFCGVLFGKSSGPLTARWHVEGPGGIGFRGVPDIPSNTPHSPVIPVEGPNATDAYAGGNRDLITPGYAPAGAMITR